MSQTVALFVDVSNLYYAAQERAQEIDYRRLLVRATSGRQLLRAYAYTGLDPKNEAQLAFHQHLRELGYRVVAKEVRRFRDGGMKANLDIELVVDLIRLSGRLDVAVIASGDGDFAAAIRAVQERGVRVEVTGVRESTSRDLIEVADVFLPLLEDDLPRRVSSKGSTAVPAKDVIGHRAIVRGPGGITRPRRRLPRGANPTR